MRCMSETSASLLDQLHAGPHSEAWTRMVSVYTPLIRGWLRRQGVADNDCDDLVQETLSVVIRRYPEFRHNQRTGAFRAWLRQISVNCLRDFWRSRRTKPLAAGGSEALHVLDQLEDSGSTLSREWDREHDLHVTRQLLDQLKPRFEPTTWKAFQRVAQDGATPAEVAAELGITVNAVFIAKSRVLSRLRQEADGLID